MSRLRIAVLMGGRSSEHDISLASGGSVIEALQSRYDTVAVEIDREGRWALPAAAPRELESAGDASPVETLPVPADSSVPATLAVSAGKKLVLSQQSLSFTAAANRPGSASSLANWWIIKRRSSVSMNGRCE